MTVAHAAPLVHASHYHFRTLDEARRLARFTSQRCPDPENVAHGLTELVLNAIEHGNLGIDRAGKTALLRAGTWRQEWSGGWPYPDTATNAFC